MSCDCAVNKIHVTVMTAGVQFLGLCPSLPWPKWFWSLSFNKYWDLFLRVQGWGTNGSWS